MSNTKSYAILLRRGQQTWTVAKTFWVRGKLILYFAVGSRDVLRSLDAFSVAPQVLLFAESLGAQETFP